MYVWSCKGVGKKEVEYKKVGLYYELRMNKRMFLKSIWFYSIIFNLIKSYLFLYLFLVNKPNLRCVFLFW